MPGGFQYAEENSYEEPYLNLFGSKQIIYFNYGLFKV